MAGQTGRSQATRRMRCIATFVQVISGAALLVPSAASAWQPRAVTCKTIQCENQLLGSPASEWDIQGVGDGSIQGFGAQMSVNKGERVEFKIQTDAAQYQLDIYRLGFYAGLGARKIASVLPTVKLPMLQPRCLSDIATGLVDCGNWAVTASWVVPRDVMSGIYIAKVTRADTGGASHIVFVVRDDAAQSDLLLQVPDATWQAYNNFGGNSLYEGSPAGRAYKVSYNRPFNNRGGKYARGFLWATEYPWIQWLERNGYDLSYTSSTDTAQRPELLKRHKVFLVVGHDEYWSAQQRANVTAARDAGINLALFTGNGMFWKTRWEPAIDGSGTAFRTLVSYKETHAGAKIDPEPTSTGTWRDPRFGRLDGSGRPENELIGNLFVTNCCRWDAVVVSASEGRRRFWRYTPVASQAPGASMAVGRGIVGYEWNADVDNGSRPAGLFRLSNTVVDGVWRLVDFGSTYWNWTGPVTHSITAYRAASGALVVSSGAIDWGLALDRHHDDPDNKRIEEDRIIQQATVNTLADMGAQPRSLAAGFVVDAGSRDHVPPAATILRPGAGGTARIYSELVVTGSAQDQGGVPAAVEVSVDGGASWHPAEGEVSWTYAFRPTTRGIVTVLARAVDDSGNLQGNPAWVSIEIVGFGALARQVALVGLVLAVVLFGLLVSFWRWRVARGR